MNKTAKIFVAGHTGLVGSAIIQKLIANGFNNILTRTLEKLDLRNQQLVAKFFSKERPEYVFLAAAKVGGIHANYTEPASFIYDNLMIQTVVVHAAYQYEVKKLLFLGSSCIYPRECPQPIQEEYLLTGPLETTNHAYAIAKIAGIELCQSYNKQYGTQFICCMPTNLYGPRDNFNPATSHVLPALIAKIYDAHITKKTTITVWGTGTPKREFLFVEDLADACLFLMHNYTQSIPINIGTGSDISIKELAELIKTIIGYQGTIIFDPKKPDGTPRKLLNVDKIHQLGWHAHTSLIDGIKKTLAWYIPYHGQLTRTDTFQSSAHI